MPPKQRTDYTEETSLYVTEEEADPFGFRLIPICRVSDGGPEGAKEEVAGVLHVYKAIDDRQFYKALPADKKSYDMKDRQELNRTVVEAIEANQYLTGFLGDEDHAIVRTGVKNIELVIVEHKAVRKESRSRAANLFKACVRAAIGDLTELKAIIDVWAWDNPEPIRRFIWLLTARIGLRVIWDRWGGNQGVAREISEARMLLESTLIFKFEFSMISLIASLEMSF